MKTKGIIKYITLAGIVATGLSACSDNWNADLEGGDGEGKLNTSSILPTVNGVTDDKDSPFSGSVTDAAAPRKAPSTIDLSNYLVDVVKSNGDTEASWTYSTMPSMPVFKVGTYTVRVRSHKVEAAEWDKPYYVGSQSFQITDGDITDVDPIVCKLGNIRVSVTFSDKLLRASNGGADFLVTVTSTPGNSLEYTAAETRSGYFAAVEGLSTMEVKFTGTVNGTKEEFTHALTGVEAGQHRKVTFTYNGNGNLPEGESGQVTIGQGIHVNCSTVTVNVDGKVTNTEDNMSSDDRPNQEGDDPSKPDDPDVPPVETISFSSETLDLEGWNNSSEFGPDIQDAIVVLKADDGFKNVKVQIDSQTLTEEVLAEVGLTSSFDLAEPGEYREGLESLGFNTGADVIGATVLNFDITQFCQLMGIYGVAEHKFIVTVIDQKDATKTLVLKFRS